MPKLSPIKAKFLIKFLSQKGFVEIRQKGSHKFFSNTRGLTTVVPYHPAKEIRPGLLRKILKLRGLKPSDSSSVAPSERKSAEADTSLHPRFENLGFREGGLNDIGVSPEEFLRSK